MIRSTIVTIHNAPPARSSKIQEIIESIRDPKVVLSDLLRLIALEMALIVEDLQKCEGNPTTSSYSKSHMEQVKALHLLTKQLYQFIRR